MKIANIIKKLENTPEATDIKITADKAQWGGYNVKLTALIGDYYDVEVTRQVYDKKNPERTHTMGFSAEEAIEYFKQESVEYFCHKPYHDESDLMTDYHAWMFDHRLKDIDWLVDNSRNYGGARNARATA